MKKSYNELTPEDLEYLKFMFYNQDYCHEEKMDILGKKFGVVGRTIRSWWKDKLNLQRKKLVTPTQLSKAEERDLPEDTDIVLFTSAQNKTAINRQMLNHMIIYRDFLIDKGFKTEIVIAPMRYRNPTSPYEDFAKEEWWVDEVQPFLYYNKIQMGDVELSTRTRIKPTAVNPLSGFDLMASKTSVVFPHSKIHYKPMPRFKGYKLRSLSTTGMLTLRNYSDSKAGEKASEHHSYGFVVIEKKNKDECYAPRNVKVNSDGTFTDVCWEVSNNQVKMIGSTKGIVLGDIHAAQLNTQFYEKTKELMRKIVPQTVVLHDVYDGYNVNPHETKDMYIQKKKIRENKHLIIDEINEAIDLVKDLDKEFENVKVIASNHDVFLDRHVNNFDWKKDLHNSEEYLKLAYIQQTEDMEKYGTIFGYLLSKSGLDYVNYGESLIIGDYECGLHGDHGANGARGNHKTFARLNFKMITAHEHSPAIHDGITVVGTTCEKDQYYTRKGISSSQYAHSVVHNTGKNQLWVFDDDYNFTKLI